MNVQVSVLCIAYNQEDYIGKTLESFVNQKTNFDFEVLVNDDCSTDNTKYIINEYAKKYPQLIKPIFQKENQYSKGVSCTKDILMPKAKGKYFALCEGDDYWIDIYKLQKQYDYMETHPKCTLCIHNSIYVNDNNETIGKHIITKDSRIIDTNEIIIGRGDFCMTNSIFSRMDLTSNCPEYFKFGAWDFCWQMYLASVGETYCFSDNMSAYRKNAKGSWSLKMNKKDKKTHIDFIDNQINIYELFNKESNYKYDDSIQYLLSNLKADKCLILENPKMIKNLEVKLNLLIKRKKIRIYLLKFCPIIYKICSKIRGWT